MRILVTGATGFVGATLIRQLRQGGHDVFALIRDERTRLEGCQPVVWDIGNPGRPPSLPQGLDAIVHAAQSRNYRAFPGDCNEMFQVNVASTLALLNYAVDIGTKHFCLISTGNVYEPYAQPLLNEDDAVAPHGFLGASKLASEILAHSYAGVLSLCALRLFFPYGPGQVDRLVPNIINRVKTGTPVQISMDGQGLRLAPTFVDDIAQVIEAAATERWTGTYNVASPEHLSLAELATTIGDIVGKAPIFELTPQLPPNIVPSLVKLERRFDFARFTPLREGLEATL